MVLLLVGAAIMGLGLLSTPCGWAQEDSPAQAPVSTVPSESQVPVAPGELTVVHPETASAREEETAHPEGEAKGEGEEGGVPEVPNLVQLIYEYLKDKAIETGQDPNKGVAGLFKVIHKGPLKEPLPIVGTIPWEGHVFAVIAALFILLLFRLGVRRMDVRSPSRMQMVVERIVGLFDEGIGNILGPKHGRVFAPYIMALFLYILINNLMVLVPFMKSSTSSLVLTGSLAILTFVIVQATALINLGPFRYLYHLAGEPKGAVMWILTPLFLVLHVVGELARPVSLSLRLFGNILGEDILLGAFLGMGIALAGTLGIHPPLPGFPLQFPFMFLVILGSVIQALVFSLLTTIYILLVLPHDEGHDGHGEESHAEETGRAPTAAPTEAPAA